jgi:hypothetical protein
MNHPSVIAGLDRLDPAIPIIWHSRAPFIKRDGPIKPGHDESGEVE